MLRSFRLKYHGFSKFIIKFLLKILQFPPFPLLIIIRLCIARIHNSFNERVSFSIFGYPDFSRNPFIDAKESTRAYTHTRARTH